MTIARRARPGSSVLLLGVLFASACTASDRAPEGRAPTLSDAVEIGLPNAREPIPGLVTGGQPTPDQLAALRGAGYTRFVSLRPAAEDGAGWEEGRLGSDVAFDRIPITGARDLTRENVAALDRLLDEAAGSPTVVYCASGNRVGALLALRAFWMDGASAEEALSLGRRTGMTRLEPAVAALLTPP